MIKVIRVTYGTHGKSKEYTYLTDREVSKGKIIQPSVKHYKSGKIFSTTAKIMDHPHSPNSYEGMKDMKNAVGNEKDLQAVFTYKDASILNKRDKATGRFVKVEKGNKIAFAVDQDGNKVVSFSSPQITGKEQQLRNFNTNARVNGDTLEFQDQISGSIEKVREKIDSGELDFEEG